SVDHRYLHSFPTRRSSDLGDSSPLSFLRFRSKKSGDQSPYSKTTARPEEDAMYDPTQLPAWKALEAHQPEVAALHLRDLFRQDRSEEHTSELQSRFDLVCR